MKFRTEIEIEPFRVQISHQNSILALGSCFAEHMARRLADAKFRITTNPSGILFNPLSIAAALHDFADQTPIKESELHFDGEMWFHYGFHGDFSVPTADMALSGMNAARRAGAEALQATDRLLVTFGTAWVFEHEGKVVANCHRRPATEFSRRRAGVEEIVRAFSGLLTGPLRDKEVILTVSPVRHLGDSLQGNSVSKASLRLAIEELVSAHANVHYFPAYEILCDDLRDYRFYADDMVHPAPQAVEYVWEKFSDAVFSNETRHLLYRIHQIVTAAVHRPRNPQSESHREFCRQTLQKIAALPQVDFHTEAEYFRRCMEINS
ncbi:GSCFA domain-containing protein [uncultured Alistipes sp.]|jgi:GSCFA family protein|uniref:GSCFA domain-containing protein n=1 Tax=uncultured Alistipes sp. TaxID=538949 RepID=UPI0025CF80AF|nr:GSCFA domain-containing protein [uncultured Alistipes sp.]